MWINAPALEQDKSKIASKGCRCQRSMTHDARSIPRASYAIYFIP
jgi:hypothetical protein